MLEKPVAIVTGSSRGIGRGIATRLAEAGYAVVVNYASRADAAEEVVREIEAKGGTAIAVGGKVGIAEDRHRLIDAALEQFGRLDVLVNNAGITSQGRKDILEATEESWEIVFDTNLKGPFFLTQLAANAMIASIKSGAIPCGKIVNVSSISAWAVSVNRADYCMTKAAMQMMTKLYAQRLARENILVYEICPGVIESDMTAPVKGKIRPPHRRGNLADPALGPPRRDVAKAVLAIVGDSFPFSTGECFNIDGGFHIRSL